jgi:cell division protein FtsQ
MIKRRTIISILVILAVILFGCVWYYLKCSGSFPIKKVHINSQAEYISQADIEKIIYPYINKGFFNINIKDLKSKLLNVPGVKFVSIKRQWPTTLLVAIKDEKAVARWGVGGLVSSSGMYFNPTYNSKLDYLPQFVCKKKYIPKVLSVYKKLLLLISEDKNLELTIMSLEYRANNWVVSFNQGTMVILGRKDIFNRLKLFLKYQPMLIHDKDKKYPLQVDMRYPNGFAVSDVKRA